MFPVPQKRVLPGGRDHRGTLSQEIIMSDGTKPGLEMFSDAWFAEVATNVPEPLRSGIQEVCRAFQLGDHYAPNTIAKLIQKGFMVTPVKIKVGDGWYRPFAIEYCIDDETWRLVSVDSEGHNWWFLYDQIEEVQWK